jgi:NTE family protein
MPEEGKVQKADAVFEGGGVKGIGLVGALQAFEEAGYEWQNLAGTSAGSIVATLSAVGYSAAELKEVMKTRVEFRTLMDAGGIGRIPVVGPWLSLLFSHGMYRGDVFLQLMRDLIEEKTGAKRLTFGDLVMPKLPTDSQEDYENKYKYKLHVIASDVSNNSMMALPQSVKHLGLDPDKLEVAQAVRMSVSFPYFFRPVILQEGGALKRMHWILDGGMLSNFPIWLFDSPPGEVPAWPTIGFLLAEPQADTGPYQHIRGLASMTRAMVRTMSSFFDRKALEESDKTRVVKIPTGVYKTLDLNLTDRDKEWLYNSGKKAAEEFLASFEFEEYKVRQMAARRAPGRSGRSNAIPL